MKPATVFSCALTTLIASSLLNAAEPAPKPLAKEFDNPCGITVQPTTGHLFVAARDGIYRVDPTTGQKFAEVTGYPTDIYGKGPKYNVGPMGVAFVNDVLAVGDGSRPDAQELVRFYQVGTKPAAKPVEETSAVATVGPIVGGEASAKGEGNFYAIAVKGNDIYITANGDDTKGWVLKSGFEGGKAADLTPHLATKPEVGVDAPVGITIGPKGELVIGQMGEVNVPGDSLLTIYDADSKKLLKSYKTGLHDIAGLAYSPKTGKLYAVDFAWVDVTQGGLFELTVSGDEVKATKVASLLKPTALTFGADGSLFVTIFGDTEAGNPTPGSVVKFAPGL